MREAVGVVAEGETGRAHAEARERGRGELRAGGLAKRPGVHPAMRVRVPGRIRLTRCGMNVKVNAAARVVVHDLMEREVENGQDDDANEIAGDRRDPGGSVPENQRARPGPNRTRKAAVVTSRGGSAGSEG